MTQESVFFKGVKSLSGNKLEVEMGTNTQIVFDFNTRLVTARFGSLSEESVFKSVYTDGSYLFFEKDHCVVVKITAKEFMDLVLIDRTNGF